LLQLLKNGVWSRLIRNNTWFIKYVNDYIFLSCIPNYDLRWERWQAYSWRKLFVLGSNCHCCCRSLWHCHNCLNLSRQGKRAWQFVTWIPKSTFSGEQKWFFVIFIHVFMLIKSENNWNKPQKLVKGLFLCWSAFLWCNSVVEDDMIFPQTFLCPSLYRRLTGCCE
jgi:hypothetical protein